MDKKKLFDNWNEIKKTLDDKERFLKFRSRDIFYMHVGQNVGYESFGKGEEFLRPVLVYKKLSKETFLGIPLTTKEKKGNYYFKFNHKNRVNYAMFNQVKVFDINRVKFYYGEMSENTFENLSEKFEEFIKITPQKEEVGPKGQNSGKILSQNNLNVNSKIVVFGGSGLVGSAIIENLLQKGYKNIIAVIHNRKADLPKSIRQVKLDLLDSIAVENFFQKHQPEYIFLAAAKVGGIVANNTYRADFIYENLQIQNNVIYNAYKYKVKKLMFLGSTCIYPKNCPQPIKEEYLLTGELEYTNEPYAIAKIAGIKMCESFNIQYNTNFISVMPTNLYGKNDNFDLEKSHVLPALIRKIHLGKMLEENNWEEIKRDLDKNPIKGFRIEDLGFSKIAGNSSKEDILKGLKYYGIAFSSKLSASNSQPKVEIEIWGSGKPQREFLYSDDMADACVFLMEKVDFQDIITEQFGVNKSCDITEYKTKEIRNSHINIGTGKDISIKELAYLIKDIVGYKGEFYFNPSKPDGTMKKLTDVTKLNNLGWKHKVELKDGIKEVYEWYKGN